MGMLDYLEQDKGTLQEAIRQAPTREQTAQVIHKELDYLLLRFNEQCSVPAEREAAASMMQTLQLAVPLLDTVGETRVWSRQASAAEKKEKSSLRERKTWLLAGAALICLVVLTGFAAGQMKEAALTPILLILLLAGMGGGLAFLAGLALEKPSGRGPEEQQVEVLLDQDKVYRQLHATVLAMDRSLEELGKEEQRDLEQARAQAAMESDPAEWDLLAGFLEAAYSSDGEYALEQCGNIRFYLHRRGIELVDFSEETKDMFDVLPSKQAGTLRPALVSDGKVLKKGLAAGGLA